MNLLLAFFFLFPSSVSPLFLFPLSKSKATPLLLATFFRVCVFGQLNEQRRERQQRAAEEERRSVVSKKKKKGKKKTLLCFFSPLVPFLCPSRSPFLSGASSVQRCSHTEHFSFSRPPPLPPRRRRQRLRVKKKKRKTSGPHHCRRGRFWLPFLFIPIHAFRSLQLCSETQTPTVPPKTSASS